VCVGPWEGVPLPHSVAPVKGLAQGFFSSRCVVQQTFGFVVDVDHVNNNCKINNNCCIYFRIANYLERARRQAGVDTG
jgi:hypothetical protein